MPFLGDLFAIRILAPVEGSGAGEEGRRVREGYDRFVGLPDDVHEDKMASSLSEHYSKGGTADFAKLKYIGLGPKVWEVGGMVEEVLDRSVGGIDEHDGSKGGKDANEEKKIVYRRKIKRIEERDVQHVEIWKMDSLDIV